MSHDQNFKNLILDYPRQAVGFFAAVEAQAIDAGARILPIREEQLKERLGERFRELDVPPASLSRKAAQIRRLHRHLRRPG
jgi:hypothetical protein